MTSARRDQTQTPPVSVNNATQERLCRDKAYRLLANACQSNPDWLWVWSKYFLLCSAGARCLRHHFSYRRVPLLRALLNMADSVAVQTFTGEQDTWSVYTKTRSTVNEQPLSKDEIDKVTRYFHATMYLCLGMLYLRDNPLLQEPLKKEHLKPRLLGHWGSDAGQSFT